MALAAGEAILPHFREIIDVEDKRNVMGYDPVTIADRAAEEVIRAEIMRASSRPWHPWRGTRQAQRHVAAHMGDRPHRRHPQLHPRPVALGDADRAARRRASGSRRRAPALTWARPSSARRAAWRNGGAATRGERCALAAARGSRTPSSRPPTPGISSRRASSPSTTPSAVPSRLTRFGGDCYCYTQLAMGFVDMVVETGLQPYDVQALIPLVEAAGGVITNWSGGPCDQGGDVFACGDRELHAKVHGTPDLSTKS